MKRQEIKNDEDLRELSNTIEKSLSLNIQPKN